MSLEKVPIFFAIVRVCCLAILGDPIPSFQCGLWDAKWGYDFVLDVLSRHGFDIFVPVSDGSCGPEPLNAQRRMVRVKVCYRAQVVMVNAASGGGGSASAMSGSGGGGGSSSRSGCGSRGGSRHLNHLQ